MRINGAVGHIIHALLLTALVVGADQAGVKVKRREKAKERRGHI
jgi:hypothetical protein